ncbi:MAG: hypothetical protein R2879_04190 [Saprospiraceae bacterium]
MEATFQRIGDIFKYFPVRFIRLVRHLFFLEKHTYSKNYFVSLAFYLAEIPIHILDILGLGEWIELGLIAFQKNDRKLLEEENEIALKYFKKFSWVSRIRINEQRRTGTRKGRIVYVSGSIINSYGSIQNDVLVHEMVHVWQYFEKGLVYIPRALWAQKTNEGYNYGGKEALEKAIQSGIGLDFFNYEQQAALVQDHYRGLSFLKYRYSFEEPDIIQPIFEKILKQSGIHPFL